jgi:hypothetical protein
MKINYQKKLFKPIPTKQNTCRARRIKQQLALSRKDSLLNVLKKHKRIYDE